MKRCTHSIRLLLTLLLTAGSLLAANGQEKTLSIDAQGLRKQLDSILISFRQIEDVERRVFFAEQLRTGADQESPMVTETLDIMYAEIASEYARRSEVTQMHAYIEKIQGSKLEGYRFLTFVNALLAIGNLDHALTMLRASLDETLQHGTLADVEERYHYAQCLTLYLRYVDDDTYRDRASGYLEALYNANGTYFDSDIGLRQRDKEVPVSEQFFFQYAKLLCANNETEKAVEVVEGAVRNGSLPESWLAGVCTVLDASGAVYRKVSQLREEKDASFSQHLASLFAKPDINGKRWDPASFQGKYVLLDFWGSWCLPCRFTHPDLIKTYDKYRDHGLEIVGIAFEFPKDVELATRQWQEAVEEDNIPWIHLLNNIGIETFDAIKAFHIGIFPTKILLNKNGQEVARFYGGKKESFEAHLQSLFGF